MATDGTPLWDLSGKLALVTGAGRGLGRAMALALAEHGCDLALVARSEGQLKKTAKAITKLGRRAVFCSFDLTDAEGIPDLVEGIENEAGTVDILVNNAGATRRAAATEMALEDWDAVMSLNVRSMFVLTTHNFYPKTKIGINSYNSSFALQGYHVTRLSGYHVARLTR